MVGRIIQIPQASTYGIVEIREGVTISMLKFPATPDLDLNVGDWVYGSAYGSVFSVLRKVNSEPCTVFRVNFVDKSYTVERLTKPVEELQQAPAEVKEFWQNEPA